MTHCKAFSSFHIELAFLRAALQNAISSKYYELFMAVQNITKYLWLFIMDQFAAYSISVPCYNFPPILTLCHTWENILKKKHSSVTLIWCGIFLRIFPPDFFDRALNDFWWGRFDISLSVPRRGIFLWGPLRSFSQIFLILCVALKWNPLWDPFVRFFVRSLWSFL